MNFAQKLTALRKSRGWSQEELGEKLGVTRQTISKWELGSTTPEMEKLSGLCELFGISANELIGTPEPQIPEPKEAFLSDENKTAEPQLSPEPQISERKKGFSHGEYKSAKTVKGVPLVHVNFKGTACGIFAVGLAARGVVAVGIASFGVLSLGIFAAGVLALGLFGVAGVFALGMTAAGIFAFGAAAAGLVSFGGISAGWLSFGGISVGKYAFGGLAVGDIALGGSARGIIAIGDSVSGEIELYPPVPAELFEQIVRERLPHTPDFIIKFFSALADNMEVGG